MLTSLIVFTVLYGVLAVVWFELMHRYASEGVPSAASSDQGEDAAEAPLSFAY